MKRIHWFWEASKIVLAHTLEGFSLIMEGFVLIMKMFVHLMIMLVEASIEALGMILFLILLLLLFS